MVVLYEDNSMLLDICIHPASRSLIWSLNNHKMVNVYTQPETQFAETVLYTFNETFPQIHLYFR